MPASMYLSTTYYKYSKYTKYVQTSAARGIILLLPRQDLTVGSSGLLQLFRIHLAVLKYIQCYCANNAFLCPGLESSYMLASRSGE